MSSSHSLNDSYNNYNNSYIKKDSSNNKLINQSQKNIKHKYNDQDNYYNNSNNKSRRKNTYTLGQGIKKYIYNNEQSKIIVDEENEKNLSESRSNSNGKLGNN